MQQSGTSFCWFKVATSTVRTVELLAAIKYQSDINGQEWLLHYNTSTLTATADWDSSHQKSQTDEDLIDLYNHCSPNQPWTVSDFWAAFQILSRYSGFSIFCTDQFWLWDWNTTDAALHAEHGTGMNRNSPQISREKEDSHSHQAISAVPFHK